MVFCRHCGKDIPDEETSYCPSCGKPQNDVPGVPGVVSPTQTKSPGTTLAIALIAGAFGFNGIGHLYIGKIKKGLGLMVAGWILIALPALILPLVMISSEQPFLLFLFLPISIVIFVALWTWQAYDAYKQTKYYNEYLDNNGRAPW